MSRIPHPYLHGELVVVLDCADLARAATQDLDAEVSRVTARGATVLTDSPIVEDGFMWHILADPDGNELCVLQPTPPN